jgi:polyphosphate kinase
VLESLLSDDRQAWNMQPDGTYVQRIPADGADASGTHAKLMKLARDAAAPDTAQPAAAVPDITPLP